MEAQEINTLIEILVAKRVETARKDRPYYLLGVTQQAGHEVLAYEFATIMDELLSFDGVNHFSFDFEHEYNDEGGTYLSVTGSLSYTLPDGEEETGTIYGGDDFDIPDDFVEQWDETKQERFRHVLGQVSSMIENLDDSEVNYASSYYETTFKKDTVFATYQKTFPAAFAIIEKHMIEQNIDMDAKGNRGAYKM